MSAKIISSTNSNETISNEESVSVQIDNDNLPFINSNLWIRFVDKRTKMSSIINSAQTTDDLSSEQKKLLSDIFLKEVGSIGPMMFNTFSDKTKELWDVRNKLSPLLNSILFTPFIKLETLDDELELTNDPASIIRQTLKDNENVSLTQIENLQVVLDKIKNNSSYHPESNLDLNNKIVIQDYNVEWINEGFVTREAKINIYLEHEQLLKTKLIEYLTTLANKVKITTGFFNLFEKSHGTTLFFNDPINTDFNKFLRQFNFDDSLGGELWGNMNPYYGYYSMVEASKKDSENDEWTIYNFSTQFDENNGVILTLELNQFGYNTKKRFSDIKPIQLLDQNVINYLRSKSIIKSSTMDYGKRNNPDLAFVPKVVVSNNKSKSSRSQEQNKYEDKSFLLIDVPNFMLHLLWLQAWEYMKLHNEINNEKISNNFLITYEIDMSDPKLFGDSNERFDGSLLNYVNLSQDDEEEFKSFSLFDFEKLQKYMKDGTSYTDMCFQYLGTEIKETMFWNFNLNEEETNIDTKSISAGWQIWRDLIALAPQTCFIEEKKDNFNQFYYDGNLVDESTINSMRNTFDEQERVVSTQEITLELARQAFSDSPGEYQDYENLLYVLDNPIGRKADYLESAHFRIKQLEKKIRTKSLKQIAEAREAIESKITVEEVIPYYLSYYFYPIYKVSTQTDSWIDKLNLDINSFLKEIVQSSYQWRINAVKNFNIQSILDVKNEIEKYPDEADICKLTWEAGIEPLPVIKYKQEKEKTKDENGKEIKQASEAEQYASIIDPQLDSFGDLSFNLIVHDDKYLEKVEPGFKSLIQKLHNDGTKGWIEIVVSDANNHLLNSKDYETFMQLQKEVFENMDKNVPLINKYYDNNIISLQSSSETQSDLPYEIGAFSLPKKKESSLDDKLVKIKEYIQKSENLPEFERKKVLNRVSMMKLMASSDNSTPTNTQNIVQWIDSSDNGVTTQQIYNSLSGSDFITSFDHIGNKKELVMSLYDSLLFKTSVKNWYVPGIKIFSPIFIYSAKDSALSVHNSILNENLITQDQFFDINYRMAPQTGMYKITKLSYSIDQYGNWIQDWEAVKLDYGFLNQVYQIIYEDADLNKNLDVFGAINYDSNFFNTNFVIPSFIYNESDREYDKILKIFDPAITSNLLSYSNSLLGHIENNSFSWFNDIIDFLSSAKISSTSFSITSVEDQETVNLFIEEFDRYRKLLSITLLGESVKTENSKYYDQIVNLNRPDRKSKQSFWPINSFNSSTGYLLSDWLNFNNISSTNPTLLKENYNSDWFTILPINGYNYESLTVPFLATKKTLEFQSWWNNDVAFSWFPSFIWDLNNPYKQTVEVAKSNQFGKFATNLDSFIVDNKFDTKFLINDNPFTHLQQQFPMQQVFTCINDFKNALNAAPPQINLDTGTIITIQRLDHPSISEDLLFEKNSIINYNENKIQTNYLQFFDKIYGQDNYAWRVIEKYFIVDSSSILGLIYSEDFKNAITGAIELKQLNTPLTSWKNYISQSINPVKEWSQWLTSFGLNYQANFSNIIPKRYYSQMLINWAKDFLSNFYDKAYFKEPYEIIPDTSTTSYTVEFGGEEKNSIEFYNDFYQNYVSISGYKLAIGKLYQNFSSMRILEQGFKDIVINPLNTIVEQESFSQSVLKQGGGEEIAKTLIKRKFEQLKKNFQAYVITSVLFEFLQEWLAKAKEEFLACEYPIHMDKSHEFSMKYDFVLLHLEDKTNITFKPTFSAIRWNYLLNKDLNLTNSLNAEFITNMNVDQLLSLSDRNEKYFFEKMGYQKKVNNVDKKRKYDKWLEERKDIEILYPELANFETEYTDENNWSTSGGEGRVNYAEETLDDIRKRYGLLRIIVDNRFTMKNMFFDQKNKFDEYKIESVDKWKTNEIEDKKSLTYNPNREFDSSTTNRIYSLYYQVFGGAPLFNAEPTTPEPKELPPLPEIATQPVTKVTQSDPGQSSPAIIPSGCDGKFGFKTRRESYKLSDNFTYRDLVWSDTADEYNFPNCPNAAELENLVAVCEDILEPIAETFGRKNIEITSGFRGQRLSEYMKATESQHRLGEAVDIKITPAFWQTGESELLEKIEIFNQIANWNDLNYNQCIAEEFTAGGGWIHIGYKPNGGNKGQVWLKRRDNRPSDPNNRLYDIHRNIRKDDGNRSAYFDIKDFHLVDGNFNYSFWVNWGEKSEGSTEYLLTEYTNDGLRFLTKDEINEIISRP